MVACLRQLRSDADPLVAISRRASGDGEGLCPWVMRRELRLDAILVLVYTLFMIREGNLEALSAERDMLRARLDKACQSDGVATDTAGLCGASGDRSLSVARMYLTRGREEALAHAVAQRDALRVAPVDRAGLAVRPAVAAADVFRFARRAMRQEANNSAHAALCVLADALRAGTAAARDPASE